MNKPSYLTPRIIMVTDKFVCIISIIPANQQYLHRTQTYEIYFLCDNFTFDNTINTQMAISP